MLQGGRSSERPRHPAPRSRRPTHEDFCVPEQPSSAATTRRTRRPTREDFSSPEQSGMQPGMQSGSAATTRRARRPTREDFSLPQQPGSPGLSLPRRSRRPTREDLDAAYHKRESQAQVDELSRSPLSPCLSPPQPMPAPDLHRHHHRHEPRPSPRSMISSRESPSWLWPTRRWPERAQMTDETEDVTR